VEPKSEEKRKVNREAAGLKNKKKDRMVDSGVGKLGIWGAGGPGGGTVPKKSGKKKIGISAQKTKD